MALKMSEYAARSMSDLRWEPAPYRVRAHAGEQLAVDTRAALLVWEPRRVVPAFAVPPADLVGTLEPLDPQPPPPEPSGLPPVLGPDRFALHTTPGQAVQLVLADRRVDGFVPDDPDLGGAVLLDFAGLERWLVEDAPIVSHPHDPFKRIDVVESGRQVLVSRGSQLLADTRRARLLLETGLPPRWYLPTEDVRMDLLEESDTTSTCAYKGHASYLSLQGGPADIAWRYQDPLHDALPVAQHICFWAERTDLTLDGVRVARPRSPWSDPD